MPCPWPEALPLNMACLIIFKVFSKHPLFLLLFLNGSPVAGATDSFYVFTQAGTYAVRITDGNGCSSLSAGVFLSAHEVMMANEPLFVFPNPASGKLTVAGLHFSEGTTWEIYNA